MPGLLQSRLPANPRKELATEATGKSAPSAGGGRNLILIAPAPGALSEMRSDQKSAERPIRKLPFQHLVEKLLRTSKEICASRVRLLVLYRRQVKPIWGAFLKTPACVLSMPTCNYQAKSHPASTPHTWRTCPRIQYDGKYFIL